MDTGFILLGLLIASGAVFGVIMIAGANSNIGYSDTFGTTTNAATNASQSTIINSTSSIMGAGGGIALILAVFFLFSIAVVLIGKSFGSHGGGR